MDAAEQLQKLEEAISDTVVMAGSGDQAIELIGMLSDTVKTNPRDRMRAMAWVILRELNGISTAPDVLPLDVSQQAVRAMQAAAHRNERNE